MDLNYNNEERRDLYDKERRPIGKTIGKNEVELMIDISKDRNNKNIGLINLLKNGIDVDMVHFTLLYNKPETNFNLDLLDN